MKGTVAQEKLFNWGLGVMDWTLTIDRTWFLHFSDQLFNCHNIWTVYCLDVKPVWSLSETDALCWLIVHAGVAVTCLLVCELQTSSAAHPPSPSFPQPLQARHCIPSPQTTCMTPPPPAVRTLILSYCCSLHSIGVQTATVTKLNITWISCFLRTATTAQYYCADCNNTTVSVQTATTAHSETASESDLKGFTSRQKTVKIL